MHEHESEQFDLPTPIANALKRSSRRDVSIPPTLDVSILLHARRQMRLRRRFRRAAAIATAAAAAITIALLAWPSTNTSQTKPPVAASLPGDLNGDGKVDILDAFQLARELPAKHTDPSRDFNHDGSIDQHDVDAIARQSVSLVGVKS